MLHHATILSLTVLLTFSRRSHLVNPLQLSGDPAEKQIFDASDARMGSKKAEQQRSLQIEAPTPEESRMMHKLYLACVNCNQCGI